MHGYNRASWSKSSILRRNDRTNSTPKTEFEDEFRYILFGLRKFQIQIIVELVRHVHARVSSDFAYVLKKYIENTRPHIRYASVTYPILPESKMLTVCWHDVACVNMLSTSCGHVESENVAGATPTWPNPNAAYLITNMSCFLASFFVR